MTYYPTCPKCGSEWVKGKNESNIRHCYSRKWCANGHVWVRMLERVIDDEWRIVESSIIEH